MYTYTSIMQNISRLFVLPTYFYNVHFHVLLMRFVHWTQYLLYGNVCKKKIILYNELEVSI